MSSLVDEAKHHTALAIRQITGSDDYTVDVSSISAQETLFGFTYNRETHPDYPILTKPEIKVMISLSWDGSAAEATEAVLKVEWTVTQAGETPTWQTTSMCRTVFTTANIGQAYDLALTALGSIRRRTVLQNIAGLLGVANVAWNTTASQRG